MRQIHLDFHTGPHIPDVGRDFDARAFAATLDEARVNSITLFAKCHHGHLYYDTNRPERHPGLRRDLNLLEAQIDACRARGIRTPIYLSVMCDEHAANTNPQWVARNPDGTSVGRKPLSGDAFNWQILDMSSPYADYLEAQIVEVVSKFKPVDGLFLDMCWDQPSVSRWAIEGMKRDGLDPTVERDRATHARRTVHRYMERYNRVIEQVNGSLPRVWYNSRPKSALAEERKFLRHVEIEALPTGGWGYMYFPLNVRMARNFGLPCLGMTARFHKSWSDFGGYKPEAALVYEVSQMLAHGTACSVGDQLHPRGTLDTDAYKLIGSAYRHVEACEPLCRDARPVTDVAVLRSPDGVYNIKPGDTYEGVVRLLQPLLVQFDVLTPQADWSGHRLVIVPESITLDAALSARLMNHIAQGGRVLLAGVSPLTSASAELRQAAGVAAHAPATYATPFFRYDRSVVGDVGESDLVCYDGSLELTPAQGARVPARLVAPYFQRSWDRFCGHSQSPPDRRLDAAPAALTARAGATGFDLFAAYARHGQAHIRRLARALIDGLMPDPLVKGAMPSHAEVSLTRLGSRTIVHVLSYAPQRRTPDLDIVEEPTPIVGGMLSVRADRVSGVSVQPEGRAVPFNHAAGYVSFEVNSTRGHDLFVID
jgi:hypothetical protein